MTATPDHTSTNTTSHPQARLTTETTQTPQARVELDVNDSPECRGGLNYLATHQATVTITTEGNDRKITRQLVDIPTDGDPSLKQPDEHHPDTGSTMRIPRERIISVAARYQRLTDTRSSCGSP